MRRAGKIVKYCPIESITYHMFEVSRGWRKGLTQVGRKIAVSCISKFRATETKPTQRFYKRQHYSKWIFEVPREPLSAEASLRLSFSFSSVCMKGKYVRPHVSKIIFIE